MTKQDQIEKLEKEKIELEGEVQKLTIKNNWLNLELEKAHSNYLESINELRNRLYEENARLEGEVQRLMIENEVLNDRIDKAIEYINNWLDGKNNDDIIIVMNNLGNILKGEE